MMSKIKSICLGILICGLSFGGIAFSQGFQFIPVNPLTPAPPWGTPGSVSPSYTLPSTGQSGIPQAGFPSSVPQGQYVPPNGQYVAPQGQYPVVTQPPGTIQMAPPPAPALPPAAPSQPPLMPGQIETAPAEAAAPQRPPAAPPGVQAPAVGAELSPFEQFVSGKIPSTISFDIKQFGYDLFLTMPSAMAPIQNVPVNPEYILGPGDELRITVWGSIDGSWSVVVDRDGNISLPKLGVLGVAGLTFIEVKDLLQKEMSKYYSDFQMNVSMGALKTMRVYVVGNAKSPGAYSISSLSTLVNALVVAGGPSKAGSMREIQLKRNGEIISRFDLYDLLMNGDKTKDQRLLSEDVVFIPSIGPLVGVAGNVERPAIFELKGRTKVSDVIKMAGGVTAEAYLQRVQVERVFQRVSKVMLDLNLQGVKGKDDIFLEGGDIVKVFSIVSTVTNRITLKGNVRRPGEYEWKSGMRVKSIIPNYDSLLPDTLLEYAIVERQVPPDRHMEYRAFNIGQLLSGVGGPENNIPLQPYDTVTVFNKWEVRSKEVVRITGAVNKPGDFEYRPNMKISDFLKVAGGLKPYAFTESGELTRVIPTQQGPKTERIYINLAEALAGNPQADIELKENDYLLVKAVPDWQLYRKVSIEGEVRFPGSYALKKGDVLSSLIERAGGYTDRAYLRGATFIRESVREVQQSRLTEMVNRLERELLATSSAAASSAISTADAELVAAENKQKAIFISALKQVQARGRMTIKLSEVEKLKKTSNDITLEEGDSIYVPANPQVVQVLGAVYNQSAFVFNPKKEVSYYIDQAGGYSETADDGNIYILKCDGSAAKPKGGFFWDTDSHRWESGHPGLVEPGDTIIVPSRLSEIAWLRNVKDITQIVYQIAVGAGVLARF